MTHAPLLRLLAASESDGSWVAIQLMHHAISDHSSDEKLQTEIRAIIDGKIEILMTPTTFRNFVAQTRLGISLAEHEQFFTEMLGDIDEPFGLREVDQDGFDINEAHSLLSQRLNDQLRAYARNLQVSLPSIFHLAWAQVLAKASGREAVVFGTVLLGRLQAGEGNNIIMGPMINTLPVRLNIDEKSVKTAVRDTHARLSALLDHEHASRVLAQRCSGVPTGLPLFNAILNYRHDEKTGDVKALLPGVHFLESIGQTTYTLMLSVDDNNSL